MDEAASELFTLGTVAPQFTGISIIENGSEGIPMELEMQWDGNPRKILDIKTYVGVALPVQKKKLDFMLKVIGGDLTTIPGLCDAIKGTILDSIEDSITCLARKVIPILTGDYSDLELKLTGVLELEPGKVKDIWLKLVKDLQIQRDKKNRGQENLELLYCSNGMNNVLSNPFPQNEPMTSLERFLKNSVEGNEVSPNGSETNNRREAII
ncbi:hypothetical protein KY290_035224 [Solanum tuberosum]|uniref:Uncharacterized protein n=1 Tax=Solanum tuberosum TaxID=4113 RepID=A0ABQ7U5H9_SOLTU|nr:hypothetical protein KY289_033101 [Solanum tuberosum]KAH0649582.1 hypothetical protein KY285_034830 [Solanum tuberosum]KAH0742181.1 hypothetical protein KY290_035224 [Solanum tuberosum]